MQKHLIDLIVNVEYIFEFEVVPVQVRDSDDFTSDVVVKSVDAVRVDEAVAGPKSGLNALLNFTKNLKIIVKSLMCLNRPTKY